MRYKIADVETCGFKPPNATSSGVCELAWLEIDSNLNVLDLKTSLINPERHIEEGASAVHGLFDVDVAGKPTMKTYCDLHWGEGPTVLICHNVKFDREFFLPYVPFVADELCTLELSRTYIKGTTNHKLPTLAKELGLQTGEAHRAAGDVVTTLSLLRHIVAVTNRSLDDLIKLSRKPVNLTEMPFGMHKGKKFHELPTGYLAWILDQGDDMPANVRLSARTAMDMR